MFITLPVNTFIIVTQADHISDLWVVTLPPSSVLKNDYSTRTNTAVHYNTAHKIVDIDVIGINHQIDMVHIK